jgi:hypothetical protein
MSYIVTHTFDRPIDTAHYYSDSMRAYHDQASADNILLSKNITEIPKSSDPNRLITIIRTEWNSKENYDNYLSWLRSSGEKDKRIAYDNKNNVISNLGIAG